MLPGVENLHENGIIHRDLKPSNVLIDGIAPWLRIKIANFGMAVMSLDTVSGIGSPRFCAPEMYRQRKQTLYNMAVAVFSTGAVFLYMFNPELSIGGYRSEDDFYHFVGCELREPLGLPRAKRRSWLCKQHS